jgi:deoxyadenosine/deoxycytidine kinase
MEPGKKPYLIGIVGPCAAGKTTLTINLKKHGLLARHIAQEHSYVADMWKRITNPDVLVFLDASYPVTLARRKLDWTIDDYNEQHFRLRHAREHANLYLSTDNMTSEEVFKAVLNYLGVDPTTRL